MCRGDQRGPIFVSDADRELFLTTLEEGCEQTGWRVHAYVLMRNHYHCLLETPTGNLVAGMRRLQSTYTRRFNGRNKLRGHLFQGRAVA
jgi:REP element-mobilizing transposase RayT